jgi:hypothetical protein
MVYKIHIFISLRALSKFRLLGSTRFPVRHNRYATDRPFYLMNYVRRIVYYVDYNSQHQNVLFVYVTRLRVKQKQIHIYFVKKTYLGQRATNHCLSETMFIMRTGHYTLSVTPLPPLLFSPFNYNGYGMHGLVPATLSPL